MKADPWADAPRHEIFALSDQLVEVTDAYGDALLAEGVAEVNYKRAYSIAFVTEDKVAATIRSKLADAKAVEEDVVLTFARYQSKILKAKVEQVHAQLMAQQSYMRFEGNVT